MQLICVLLMCFDVLYYPENDITKNSTERKTANERAEFQPPATKSIGILRGGKTESERNIPQSANERQPEKKKRTHEFNEEKIVRETRRTKKISSRKKEWNIVIIIISEQESSFVFVSVSFHSVLFWTLWQTLFDFENYMIILLN